MRAFFLVVAVTVGFVSGCCGGDHPPTPLGLDVPCNPGDPPCPTGLSCVRLFTRLTPAVDGGAGPPNNLTCRMHCDCDDQCPTGYHCLQDVEGAASDVCVVDGLMLPK